MVPDTAPGLEVSPPPPPLAVWTYAESRSWGTEPSSLNTLRPASCTFELQLLLDFFSPVCVRVPTGVVRRGVGGCGARSVVACRRV